MTKKEKSVSVEFLESGVHFLYNKRQFCNAIAMKDKKGEPLPLKRYDLPISYYEHYLLKGWIKELKVNPIKKKPVKKKAPAKKKS